MILSKPIDVIIRMGRLMAFVAACRDQNSTKITSDLAAKRKRVIDSMSMTTDPCILVTLAHTSRKVLWNTATYFQI